VLRVLSLTTRYPDAERTGAGIFVERQLRALAARDGVEVEVIAPVALPPFPLSLRRRHSLDRELPPEEMQHGLRVHRPRYLALPHPPGARPRAIERALRPVLTALRDRFPFDLIHAEFFWPEGPAAMLLARHFGVPFTIKARGPEFFAATRRRARARLALEAGRGAAALLAVSEATRQAMIEAGLPAERIAVHRTGIDTARFQPRDRAAAKAALKVTGPLLLCVGNLSARKRQALALDALRLIDDATLILVGGGPERHRLERRVEALGLERRVRLTGSIPNALLPAFYGAADVTLHTARVEGLANVWVESLACGTPVVTTDAGGAREVIDRAEAGRIVPADPAAIAAAVGALLAAPPDPAATAATVAELGWERSGAELETILRAAAGRVAEPKGP
jgi:glycosyltransferase involved in cell wall biosynthesis